MTQMQSYDIHLLGLRDPTSKGRNGFATAMHRLTTRPVPEMQELLDATDRRLFHSLDRNETSTVVDVLGDAGALVEIRPSTAPPSGGHDQLAPSAACPSCGFVQPAGGEECGRCGLVFAKFEREKIQRMQKDQTLEEALQKALQIREEWDHRAKQYLASHPMPPDATEGFEQPLRREEIPFLRLSGEDGPILLTSRRMLMAREGGVAAIPYEMVSDIDLGGGLVQKKGRQRLVLTFHGPLPMPEGEARSVTTSLDKDSTFYKDVLMDWAFARNFICGACGARDLDYRHEQGTAKARCMHCATDHDIDLREAVAIPIIKE